jgi:hypothetical protein
MKLWEKGRKRKTERSLMEQWKSAKSHPPRSQKKQNRKQCARERVGSKLQTPTVSPSLSVSLPVSLPLCVNVLKRLENLMERQRRWSFCMRSYGKEGGIYDFTLAFVPKAEVNSVESRDKERYIKRANFAPRGLYVLIRYLGSSPLDWLPFSSGWMCNVRFYFWDHHCAKQKRFWDNR